MTFMNLLNRLLAILVRLYPRDFRVEFGAEMRIVFASELEDAARHSQRLANIRTETKWPNLLLS